MAQHNNNNHNVLSYLLATVVMMVSMAATAASDVAWPEKWPRSGTAKSALAQFQQDVGDLAIIEYSGNYDRVLPSGENNLGPRQIVAAEYLAEHPDVFDFLIVFTSFEFQTGEAQAFYLGVSNDVSGIGRPLIDNSSAFASERLQGYIDMAALTRYDLSITSPGFENVLNTLLHEVMHRWGVAVSFDDGSAIPNRSLIGRDDAHWNYFADSTASVMYGADWQQQAPGQFIAARARIGYGPLDLYLGGFAAADEVPEFFYIHSANGDPNAINQVGELASGNAVPVTIDQIIAAEGPRIPDYTNSPKSFRAGMVLLVEPGEVVSDSTLANLQRVAREFQTRFGVETLGRGAFYFGLPGEANVSVGSPDLTPTMPAANGGADLALALNWLEANQDAQGWWQDKPVTRVRDTAIAIQALRSLNANSNAIALAEIWLRSVVPANNDERTWLLLSEALTAQQSQAMMTELNDATNADGGWGLGQGLTSSPLDTALVARALGTSNEQSVSYLDAVTNPGEAWGITAHGRSQVASAGWVLDSPLAANLDPTTRSDAVNWLVAQQQPDGGFGDSPTTAHGTARAILALSHYIGDFDTDVIPDAVTALEGMQASDGGWSGSVYSTASAVMALRDFDLPNLHLAGLNWQPTAPVSGESLAVDFEVINDGVLDTPTVQIALYDGDPDQGGLIISEMTVPAIEPGGRFPGQLEIDTSGLAGSHRLWLWLDSGEVLTESNETDNREFFDLTLTAAGPTPDLTLLGPLAYAPQVISQLPVQFDVSLQARNLSTLDAPAVDVALMKVSSTGATLELGRETIDLSAGETRPVAFSVLLNDVEDHQAFEVAIDPDGAITERREDDNRVAFSVPRGDAVDLAVLAGDVVIGGGAVVGEALDIGVKLRNLGTVDAPLAQFRAWVEDSAGETTDLAAFDVQLGAGTTSDRDLIWQPGAPGDFQLFLRIDDLNVIAESDETNNLAVLPITVGTLNQPNLKVGPAGLTFAPDPGLEGQTLQILLPIDNPSDVQVASVGVDFYQGDPANGGILLGHTDVGPIASGEVVIASINTAQLVGGGERLIFALIDPDQVLDEYDESDNVTFQSLQVLRLPDLAVTPASISLDPSNPVPGQPVTATVTVDNLGEQNAGATEVALFRLDGSGQEAMVSGSIVLPDLVAGASQPAVFNWTFPVDGDVVALTARVDPSESIDELNEINNSATLELAQQDRAVYVTEDQFSPNGDGIRDQTTIVFDLETPIEGSVVVVDTDGNVIRSWTPSALGQSGRGSVIWDGRNLRAAVAWDGDYRVQVVDANGRVIAQTLTTLDTNQLPLTDAIGTEAALYNDLRCSLQNIAGIPRFSADGRFLYGRDVVDDLGVLRPGLSRIATRGKGLSSAISAAWLQSRGLNVGEFRPLDDGRLLLQLNGAGGSGLYLQLSPQADPVELDLSGNQLAQILWVDDKGALISVFDGATPRYALASLQPGVPPVILDSPGQSLDFGESVENGWLFTDFREGPYHGEIRHMPHLWFVASDPGQAPVLVAAGPSLDYEVSPDGRFLAAVTSDDRFEQPADPRGEIAAYRNDNGSITEYLAQTLDLPSHWSLETSFSPDNELYIFHGHDALIDVFDAAGNLTGSIEMPTGLFEQFQQAASGGFDFEGGEFYYSFAVHNPWALGNDLATSATHPAVWRPDGDQFLVEFGLGYFSGFSKSLIGVGDRLVSQLIVVDTQSRSATALGSLTSGYLDGTQFPDELGEFTLNRVAWLARSNRILLDENADARSLSSVTGVMRDLGLGDLNAAWPWRFGSLNRKFYLQGHPGEDDFRCSDAGGQPLLVLESADNLIAHLDLERFASTIELWGIASDRHLRAYQIDWTYADQPGQWRRLISPRDDAVINGFITSWVPPTPGSYQVRLRVEDTAGNVAQHTRELTWAEQASLSNVEVEPVFISPNGDGIQDQSSIAFRVLTPLNLDVEIQDANGGVVRLLTAQFPTAGGDHVMVWDGRDGLGQVVPDGEYFVRVQNRRFRVVVDNTLPVITLELPTVYTNAEGRSAARYLVESDLQDSHLDQAELAFRRPGGSWETLLIERSSGPVTHATYRDDYILGEFRLSAHDQAGNAVQLVRENQAAELILLDIRHFSIDSLTGLAQLNVAEIPYTEPPFVPGDFPLVVSNSDDGLIFTLDATDRQAVDTVVLELADPAQPETWIALPRPPLPAEDASDYLLPGEPPADAESPYRHLVRVIPADLALPEMLLRWRVDSSAGPIHSNGIRLRLVDSDQGLRIDEFSDAIRAHLDAEDRVLFDLLSQENLVFSDNASLIWTRQLGFNDIQLSQLRVQGGDRYPQPVAFLPIARVDNGAGLFAQLFEVATDPCQDYDFAWFGSEVDGQGVERPLELGDLHVSPSFQLSRSCVQVNGHWEAVIGGFCDASPSNQIDIVSRVSGLSQAVTLEILAASVDGSFELVHSLVAPQLNVDYRIPIDTSDQPEGLRLYQLRVTDTAGDTSTEQLFIPVDRQVPMVSITSPQESQQVCAAQTPELERFLDVFGEITSNDDLAYRALISAGHDAVDFQPIEPLMNSGCDPDQGSLAGHCMKPAPVGRLATYRGGEIDGAATVLIETIDPSGARVCSIRRFDLDSRVDVQVADEFGLFSPNGDGRQDLAPIDLTPLERVTLESVELFPASLLATGEWVISGASLGSLPADGTPFSAPVSFEWDGRVGGVPLAEGRYAVSFEFSDDCGLRTVQTSFGAVDLTPPQAVIEYPKAGDPLPALVEVVGGFDDANLQHATLEYLADGGWIEIATHDSRALPGSVIGDWNLAGLPQAVYTLRLSVADRAGNETMVQETIDFSLPSSLLWGLEADPGAFSPNGDGVLDATRLTLGVLASGVFTLSIEDEPGSTVIVLQTGLPLGPGSFDYSWDGRDGQGTAVADGNYHWVVVAEDAGGGFTQTESRTIVVDTIPPLIQIDYPDQPVVSSNGLAQVTVSDPRLYQLTAYHQVDGAGESQVYGATSAGQHAVLDLSGLAEGSHQLRVVAEDSAGNVAESARLFEIDDTPPTLMVESPIDGAILGGPEGIIEFSGEVADEHFEQVSFSLRSAGSNDPFVPMVAETVTGSFALTWPISVSDGSYEIRALAIDAAGLESSQLITVALDRTPPQALLAAPTAATVVGAGYPIMGTAADAHLADYRLSISPSAIVPPQFSEFGSGDDSVTDGLLWTWHNLPPDGSYRLRLEVTDVVGHTRAVETDIIVDSAPPAPAVSLTAQNIANRDVRLNWLPSASGDVAGYRVIRGGAVLNPVLIAGSVHVDEDVIDGSYEYWVVAVDAAGNESEPSNRVEVEIDRTPPLVALLSPPDGARIRSVVEVIGTATSPDDFAEYRLSVWPSTEGPPGVLITSSSLAIDGGLIANWDTSPLLQDESYVLRLEAQDNAGNIASVERVVVVDNLAPAAPTGLVAGLTGIADAQLDWNPNGESDLAGYVLFRGGVVVGGDGVSLASAALQSTTFLDAGLADGLHRYTVIAIDQAGNVSAASDPADVAVETGPPQLAFLEPDAGTRFESPLYILASSDDSDVASVDFEYRSGAAWTPLGTDLEPPFEAILDATSEGLSFGPVELRATATDESGQSELNPPILLVEYADLTAPSAVSGLTIGVTGVRVELNWLAVADADLSGYVVVRTNAEGSQQTLTPTPVAQTTFVDNGVADGEYVYSVVAEDEAGNQSAPSLAEGLVHSLLISQPVTPTTETQFDLAGLGLIPGSIHVSVTNAIGSTDLPPFGTDAAGGFVLPAVQLAAGVNMFSVYLADGSGNTSNTSTLYVQQGVAPGAPTNLSASVTGYTVDLFWTPPVDDEVVVGYRPFRDDQPLFPDEALISGRTVTATSDPVGASSAVDGFDWSYWAPSDTDLGDGDGATLKLTFDQPRLLVEVEMTWDNNGLDIFRPRDYSLEAWSGLAWVALARLGESASEIDRVELTRPYLTDQLRVRIHEALPDRFQSVRLAEISQQHQPLVSGTSYQETRPDGVFEYQVTAISEYGYESARSNSATAEVGDTVAPDGVTLSGNASGSDATLDWTASTSADVAEYRLFRNGDPILLQTDIGNRQFVDTGLSNGVYDYLVIAVDAAGNSSDPSNTVTLTIDVERPSAPSNLTVIPVLSGGALDLAWAASSSPSITGYRIHRSLNSGGPYSDAGQSVETVYRDSVVDNGMTYFYVVTAIDALGNASDASNEASGTPRDDIPPMAPELTWPTTSAVPIDIESLITAVGGSAQPGNTVQIFVNGALRATTVANEQASSVFRDVSEYLGEARLSPVAAQVLLSGDPDFVLDLVTGERTDLPGDYSPQLAWSADGSAVYMLAGFGPVDLLRHQLETDTTELMLTWDDIRLVVPSPDDSMLFIAGSFDDGTGSRPGLWLVEAASGAVTAVGSFADSDLQRGGAQWSTDGARVVFEMQGAGQGELWMLEVQSGQVTLLQGGASPWYPIAFDGQRIAYSDESFPERLWLLDLAGGPPIPLTDGTDSAHHPRFSADGRYLAFVHGFNEVQVLEPDSQTPPLSVAVDYTTSLDWQVSGELLVLQENGYLEVSMPGAFFVDGIPLTPGENRVHAVAQEDSGLFSAPSTTLIINAPTSGVPDLAILGGDLSVQPVAGFPGEPFRTTLVVRNLSDEPVTAGVLLTLISPIGEVQELVAETMDFATQGIEVWSVDLTDLVDIGDYQLFARVDPSNAVVELDESNNVASAQISLVDSLDPTLTVALDLFEYAPDTDITGEVAVFNPGPVFDGSLRVTVEDASGFPLPWEQQVSIDDLGFGQTHALTIQWTPGEVFAGDFRFRVELMDASGEVLDTRMVDFRIARVAEFTLAINALGSGFVLGDSIGLTADVHYADGNVPQQPTIQWRISDSNDQVVWSKITVLPTVLPGYQVQISEAWPAAGPDAGTYRVSADLSSADASAVSELLLQIGEPDDPPAMSGFLGIANPIAQGLPLSVDYALENLSATDLTDLAVTISLIPVGDSSPLLSSTETVSLSAGASVQQQLQWPTTALGLGNYLVVMVADLSSAGGVAEFLLDTAAVTLIDGSAPDLVLLAPQSSSVVPADLLVRATASDQHGTVAQVTLSLDSGPPVHLGVSGVGGEYQHWLFDLTEGDHTIQLSATDNRGNRRQIDPVSFEVDRTAPELVIQGVNDGDLLNVPVTPVVLATDPHLALVVANLDGGFYDQAQEVTEEGGHLLSAFAEDEAGNRTAIQVEFVLDFTPPVVTVSFPLDGALVTTETVVVNGSTEPLATVVLGANQTQADATGEFFFSDVPLSLGPNALTLGAVDLAGNVGPEVTVQVTRGEAEPNLSGALDAPVSVAVDSPLLAPFTVTNVGFGPVTDQLVSIRLIDVSANTTEDTTIETINLAAGETHESTALFNPQALGLHRLELIAHLPSGDVVLATDNVDVFDGLPPALAWIAPSAGQVTGPATLADIQVSDQHSAIEIVEISTDGGLWESMGLIDQTTGLYRRALTALTHGAHQLQVRASDTAGNQAVSTLLIFEVDAEPPVIDIGGVTQGGLYNVAVTPIFSATDEHLESVTATLNGDMITSGTVVSDEGVHVLEVVAVDALGNQSQASVSFTIDVTPPALVITAPSDGQTIATASTTVTGQTEPFAQVTLSVGGTDQVTLADSTGGFLWLDVALEIGANLLSVVAVDPAGNASDAESITVIRLADSQCDGDPVAVISLIQDQQYAPVLATLDGSGSTGSGCDIVAWRWTLDGEEVSEAIEFSTTLNDPGQYQFTLEVEDADGITASADETIDVLADFCPIYPLAINVDFAEQLEPGDFVEDMDISSGAGNFSQLTWTGDNGPNPLAESLVPPGNSHTYVNPDDPNDHVPEVGDWVQGKPGVSNAAAVRNALDDLIGLEIILPVFAGTRGQGSNLDYELSGFVAVALVDYNLPRKKLSFDYLREVTCYGGPPDVQEQAFEGFENAALNLTIEASDPDGDELDFAIVSAPGHGLLTGDGPGYTYTPDQDFAGNDSFVVQASDGLSESAPALISIIVEPLVDEGSEIVLTIDYPVAGSLLSGPVTEVRGATSAGVQVTLVNGSFSETVIANGAGRFTFPAVPVLPGDNQFVVTANNTTSTVTVILGFMGGPVAIPTLSTTVPQLILVLLLVLTAGRRRSLQPTRGH